MSLKPIRAVRKPFYVEAVQVTGSNMEEAAIWCGGSIYRTNPPANGMGLQTRTKSYIRVEVANASSDRQRKAYPGDWILKSGNNAFKVYTNEAYHKSFDEPGDPACGLTTYTLDHEPCILNVNHRVGFATVGCRSFNDYKLLDRRQIQPSDNYDQGPRRSVGCA